MNLTCKAVALACLRHTSRVNGICPKPRVCLLELFIQKTDARSFLVLVLDEQDEVGDEEDRIQ